VSLSFGGSGGRMPREGQGWSSLSPPLASNPRWGTLAFEHWVEQGEQLGSHVASLT
jgi:hypothetical protein